MEECFLPGDVVMAKVLSYGDSKKIYLQTMENELGVIFANSSKYRNFTSHIGFKDSILFLPEINDLTFGNKRKFSFK